MKVKQVNATGAAEILVEGGREDNRDYPLKMFHNDAPGVTRTSLGRRLYTHKSFLWSRSNLTEKKSDSPPCSHARRVRSDARPAACVRTH